MLVVRLARSGAKKNPFYRVHVADQRFPRDGRFIEKLGYFNPVARGQEVKFLIDQERYDHWVSVGAQPSDRVKALVKSFAKEQDKKAEENLKDNLKAAEAKQAQAQEA